MILRLALAFAALSVFSIGGVNATLPEIRRVTVDVHHWMSDPAFAHVFAISAAAPGPNVIMVSLIGWKVAGLAGLVAATLGIVLPSSAIVYAVALSARRWAESSALWRVKTGLAPLALGLILASGVSLTRVAYAGWLSLVVTAGAAAFVVLSPRNPLWALAAGALAAIAARHLGS